MTSNRNELVEFNFESTPGWATINGRPLTARLRVGVVTLQPAQTPGRNMLLLNGNLICDDVTVEGLAEVANWLDEVSRDAVLMR